MNIVIIDDDEVFASSPAPTPVQEEAPVEMVEEQNNDDESVIPEIDRTAFEQYVEAGVIQGGMIPKLENSFQAIDAGVKQVIITQASDIHLGKGTRVF